MTFDFVSDRASLWVLKKILVMSISLLRVFLFRAIRQISSAKKIAEMLMVPRSIPRPEVLSSLPSWLMNKQKRRGDKLHPEILLCLGGIFVLVDNYLA